MHFISTNAPYVYLWLSRLLSVIMAYAYHGQAGLILLTWVLLSFMVPGITFVNATVVFVLPIYITLFLYLYFLNLSGLGQVVETLNPTNPIYTKYGLVFEIPPLEIGIMYINMMALIMLIPARFILTIQRDEFRIALFKKMSDKHSNLLWQLSFYVVKRMHILCLFLIFVLCMQEINIYFIGLMFFFVIFSTSLPSYRKYGMTLVYFASFFIWIK